MDVQNVVSRGGLLHGAAVPGIEGVVGVKNAGGLQRGLGAGLGDGQLLTVDQHLIPGDVAGGEAGGLLLSQSDLVVLDVDGGQVIKALDAQSDGGFRQVGGAVEGDGVLSVAANLHHRAGFVAGVAQRRVVVQHIQRQIQHWLLCLGHGRRGGAGQQQAQAQQNEECGFAFHG